MTSNSGQRVRLDFGNLPLVEVALRVSFESPVDLKFAIINRVGERLHSQFPLLTEPTSFERPPGIRGASVAFGPGQIPGAIYSGNPDGLIIALQSQVVVARWLKHVGKNGGDYPRFPVLRDALRQAMEAFKDACGGQLPRVVVVNISYVNFLRIAHTEPVLRRYFSDLARVKATQNADQIHRLEVSWREPDSVDLRYRLEQVTAEVEGQTVEGYQLTTAAGTRLAEGADADSALETVHDRLQLFFQDLISDHARKEWELKEVPLG